MNDFDEHVGFPISWFIGVFLWTLLVMFIFTYPTLAGGLVGLAIVAYLLAVIFKT